MGSTDTLLLGTHASGLSLLLDDLLLLLLLGLCFCHGRLLLVHSWPETTNVS
jgi:hypothetical protein